MANESTISITVQHRGHMLINHTNVNVDQATRGRSGGVMNVTTGGISLDVGAVGTPGLLSLRNLDPSNYVQWGPDNAGTMKVCGRLNPNGEPQLFRLDPSTTFKLQANGATCKVEFELLEN